MKQFDPVVQDGVGEQPSAGDCTPVPAVAEPPGQRFNRRRALLVMPAVAAAVAAACDPPKTGGSGAPPTTAPPTTTPPPTTPPPTTAPPTTSTTPPTTTTSTTSTTTSTTTTTVPVSNSAVTAELAVNKLTFGPTPGLVDSVRAMGVENWMAQQLSPTGLPDAESLLSGYQMLNLTHRQIYEYINSSQNWDLPKNEMDMATIVRARYSQRQLYELMCDFWANHFNTWREKGWMGFLKVGDHRDVVRPHALGSFRQMLQASAHSTAMLDYLDNARSDASKPGGVNQNYAREVMELHTLGIINGDHVYTEADVQAVATLLSGWTINWDNTPQRYGYQFAPWMHDVSAVSVLGGAYSRPRRTYGQGQADGEAFLDVLARHPSTARYICWKLCRRFISDQPPMNVVESAAAVFRANDTAIAPTLAHIFSTPEFAAADGSKVRRPFEHLIAVLRALNATTGTAPQGRSAGSLRWSLTEMNQPIFERESPDGYPDVNTYWATSAGLFKRWEVAAQIARNNYGWRGIAGEEVVVNLPALLPTPLPPTVAELVSWIAKNIANFTISAADNAALCSAAAINASATAATLANDATKLALVIGMILGHPQFQRR
jgi:uncharacterized protein (DUF1800 family)